MKARQLGPRNKREKFTMTCGNGDPVCSLMKKPGEMTSCLCLICGARDKTNAAITIKTEFKEFALIVCVQIDIIQGS